MRRFEESGLAYVINRNVFAVPREWPTRPSITLAADDLIIDVGTGTRRP